MKACSAYFHSPITHNRIPTNRSSQLEWQLTALNVLAYGLVAVFGVLMAVLSWLAVRLINQNDRIEQKVEAGAKLFVDEIHRHDIRISNLESWRVFAEKRQS